MKRRRLLLVAACLAAAPAAAMAQSLRQIKWADLVPPSEPFADPFAALTEPQKSDLGLLVVWRQLQARGETLPPDRLAPVTAAQARLKQANVDVEGLLARRAELVEQRRKADEAVNASLNGQQVRLAGYLLPLEIDGLAVTEFLLVPYVGACIHAPTPPPNQIVHVRHPKGYAGSGLFAPVWVRGEMRTVRSDARLTLVDGSATVPTSYAMQAEAVEPYQK
jgi:hypothetical protein